MFRKMREIGLPLSEEETIEMLKTQKHATLALHGDNGYPYAVPISFVYVDHTIIFHSAITGHKLDAIKKDSKASLCVIEQDEILPSEFNTLYRSAIVFGKVRILESNEEKRRALKSILEKYSADFMEKGKKYIESQLDNVAVLILDIEHLSGKAGN